MTGPPQEDVPFLHCSKCGCRILRTDRILATKGYHVFEQKAFLAECAVGVSLSHQLLQVNYRTGMYSVRFVHCQGCSDRLGIKYIAAADDRNQSKVGKMLLRRSGLRQPRVDLDGLTAHDWGTSSHKSFRKEKNNSSKKVPTKSLELNSGSLAFVPSTPMSISMEFLYSHLDWLSLGLGCGPAAKIEFSQPCWDRAIETLQKIIGQRSCHLAAAPPSALTVPASPRIPAVPSAGGGCLALCKVVEYWGGMDHWRKYLLTYLLFGGLSGGLAEVLLLCGGMAQRQRAAR